MTAGLCGDCAHARLLTSDRGSRFVLCRLSRTDERFARYPRLPVWRCPGYRRTGRAAGTDGSPAATPGERTADEPISDSEPSE